jgi:hypothetical protein
MSYTPTGGTAAHSEHAILPGVESLILAHTSPNAVCFLTHPALAERRIQLDADDRVYVRCHVRAPEHGATLDLDLEVTGADGPVTRHKITLLGVRAPLATLRVRHYESHGR